MRVVFTAPSASCIVNASGHHMLMAPNMPSPSRSYAKQAKLTHRGPTRIFAGEATAESAEDLVPSTSGGESTAVEQARQGYRSFVMKSCEFLVRQTPDGALDLSETFVLDPETEAVERATTSGQIPTEPAFYQAAEMATHYPGNIFEEKEETYTVLKVYLNKIVSTDPYKVSLDEIYLLDNAKKSLERLSVEWLAPPDTPEHELRARVRDRWVVVDTAWSVPSPELVVQAALQGATVMSELEMKAKELQQQDQKAETAAAAAKGEARDGGSKSSEEDEDEEGGEYEDSDVLYDDDLLKDFLVEVDDESETDFEEYDMPAADY